MAYIKRLEWNARFSIALARALPQTVSVRQMSRERPTNGSRITLLRAIPMVYAQLADR